MAPHIGGFHTSIAESFMIDGEPAFAEKQPYRHDSHQDTRGHSADSRPEQSQFRKSGLPINQKIIENYVEHVSAEQYPHRHGSERYAVGKLAADIKHHYRKHRA